MLLFLCGQCHRDFYLEFCLILCYCFERYVGVLFVILCFSLYKYLLTFYLFSIYTLVCFLCFCCNILFAICVCVVFQLVFLI